MPYKDTNKHKEAIKRWHKSHPNYIPLYSREWKKRNPERTKLHEKTYRAKHKEQIRLKMKLWCQLHANSLQTRFNKWKAAAKNRKIPFELAFNDINDLPLICYYTNEPLTLETNQLNSLSLDRIDSTKGYIKGNVVFCCQAINYMKQDFTVKEFVLLCEKVLNNKDNFNLNL